MDLSILLKGIVGFLLIFFVLGFIIVNSARFTSRMKGLPFLEHLLLQIPVSIVIPG